MRVFNEVSGELDHGTSMSEPEPDPEPAELVVDGDSDAM
jgi:hypothetical protein